MVLRPGLTWSVKRYFIFITKFYVTSFRFNFQALLQISRRQALFRNCRGRIPVFFEENGGTWMEMDT